MKRHLAILLTAFLAAFGVRADEITGLALRTAAGSSPQTPTATASSLLALGADKKPIFINTSANLATKISDETGTGSLVFGTGPTISAPTVTGVSVFADGSAANPSITLSTNPTSGLYRLSNSLGLSVDGSAAYWFGASQLNIYGGNIGLGPSSEVFLNAETTATLQLGTDHATAATSQVVKAPDTTTGTGASLTIAGGKGSVAGGSVVLATSATNGAPIPRNYVSPKEVTLTDATDTTVVNIAIAAGKYLGGELIVTTHADDGTDFQAITEHLTFSAVNKTGTVTATIQTTPSTSFTAASAGTLTTGWSIVVNGDSVDIKNNATSSLDETTLKCSYQLRLNTDGAGTVTP